MKLFSLTRAQKRIRWIIQLACYLACLALLLMVWSVLEPAALPIVIGMSLGQGIGVVALGFFLVAVLADARSRPAPSSERPPPPEA